MTQDPATWPWRVAPRFDEVVAHAQRHGGWWWISRTGRPPEARWLRVNPLGWVASACGMHVRADEWDGPVFGETAGRNTWLDGGRCVPCDATGAVVDLAVLSPSPAAPAQEPQP